MSLWFQSRRLFQFHICDACKYVTLEFFFFGPNNNCMTIDQDDFHHVTPWRNADNSARNANCVTRPCTPLKKDADYIIGATSVSDATATSSAEPADLFALCNNSWRSAEDADGNKKRARLGTKRHFVSSCIGISRVTRKWKLYVWKMKGTLTRAKIRVEKTGRISTAKRKINTYRKSIKKSSCKDVSVL